MNTPWHSLHLVKLRNWLFRPKIERSTLTLTQRKIFIIPTKQGFIFFFSLIFMLLGSINYNLSLGYMMTFLLSMVGALSMLYAFRNLANLEIREGQVAPVFNGDSAKFNFYFKNISHIPRYQLCMVQSHGSFWTSPSEILSFDVAARQESNITFPILTSQRGWLPVGRLKLYTEFPLGLFHAWAYIHFNTQCLVYPKPLKDDALPWGKLLSPSGKSTISGDDDFTGLRNYVSGDALARIAWKAFAGGRGLFVKNFSTPIGEDIIIDFDSTPDLAWETKLARMTRWVLNADKQGLHYGLRLPDGELSINHGLVHRNQCLSRIALFNLEKTAA